MGKHLSIVQEYTNAVKIDEVKLKQFLAQIKVWEYARMTEQNYRDMSPIDCFALLEDYYIYMNKVAGQGIDSATANRIKNDKTIKLNKEVAGPNQNFPTTLVAENKKTKICLKLLRNLSGRNLVILVNYAAIITLKKLIR